MLLSLLCIVSFIGTGCAQSTDTTEKNATNNVMMQNEESQNNNDEMMENVDDTMNTDNEMMKEDEGLVEPQAQEAGQYIAYDEAAVSTAATNGDAVLFFHAPWCPTCKALNDDIEANLDGIPSGMTIVKTDYDTQTELKKRYGVTYQHTLVQVDAEGNMITKWSGGNTLEDLVSHVQ